MSYQISITISIYEQLTSLMSLLQNLIHLLAKDEKVTARNERDSLVNKRSGTLLYYNYKVVTSCVFPATERMK